MDLHLRHTRQESALFAELARIFGIKLVHTTSCHPQANGMVERFHRASRAFRCSTQAWPDSLPTVLLGLRKTYKEDLMISPTEMLFGTTSAAQADTASFTRSLRQLFCSLRPVPASRQVMQHPFFFRKLRICTHVFKRVDSIRKPLELPYTSPHRMIRCNYDRTYVIEVNGTEKIVTADQLKPAFLEDVEPDPPSLAATQ